MLRALAHLLDTRMSHMAHNEAFYVGVYVAISLARVLVREYRSPDASHGR